MREWQSLGPGRMRPTPIDVLVSDLSPTAGPVVKRTLVSRSSDI